jgi:hypothetical protein
MMHTISSTRKPSALALVVAMCASSALLALSQTPAQADGPGVGAPWIVSVGDSAISGEAGRWAGNTNGKPKTIDALGRTAYDDNATGTAEVIRGCHRSKSAEVYIGNGVGGQNFACSGASTATQTPISGDFKPGLDFFSDKHGHQGQALMLQQFAASHNVRAVAVLIGANNFGFADILQTCVEDWLLSSSLDPNYCNDDASVTAKFTPAYVDTQVAAIKGAILNVRQAMLDDGYADASYTIIVQTYASPIPPGSGFRYSQSGFTRQTTGGCGLWNADADWMNNTALPTIDNSVTNAAAQTALSNIVVLDNQDALVGRRLCENTVGLLEEKGIARWSRPGAADQTEWVDQIRTASTLTGPYQLQEDAHPNYWGQLAFRDCLRQAYNGGAVRGGSCTIASTGLNTYGEPIMTLNS